jgi:hypothetical protein
LLEVVESSFSVVEVVLPESSIHLVVILVVEDSKSLSSLGRNSLSPVNETILVLKGQFLNIGVFRVLRIFVFRFGRFPIMENTIYSCWSSGG